jgi:hypothetical protein
MAGEVTLFTLSAGRVHSLIATTIYALPANQVVIMSDIAVQLANTTTTTAFSTIAATTTGLTVSAGFIRSNAANTFCSVRKV